MKNKFRRRSEYGKGWDGRSRVADKTYKENYNEIDWSGINKKEEKKISEKTDDAGMPI
jgi:hypothetical protein